MRVLLMLAITLAVVSAKTHHAREVQRMKAMRDAGVDVDITNKRIAEATEQLKRQTGKKNVLWLAVDDLRPNLGHYLDAGLKTFVSPKMHTPNIDKLAERSLVLLRHYVQQAICSPSRTVVFTGRRPDTTRVYDLETYWREVGGNFTTIPQYFKENGYRTLGTGKILHNKVVSRDYDQAFSWTDKFEFPMEGFHHYKFGHKHPWKALAPEDMEDVKYPDIFTADMAIEYLEDVAKNPEQPWFIAAGFTSPHMPFSAPQEFFDLYPLDDINMPPNPNTPEDMPDMAWIGSGIDELSHYLPATYNGEPLKSIYTGAANQQLPDQLTKDLRRAYYAAISHCDYLIGRVLDKLESLGLTDSTIIAFWGDHGFSLGEHSHWTKMDNTELGTHCPLMITVPGRTDEGIDTDALAETVDLFPTLVDAAGLPALPECPEDSSDVAACTEGSSLLPLIDAPETPVKDAAFSQFPKWILDGTGVFLPRFMGYTMRTDRYRYVEFVEFEPAPDFTIRWDKNHGTELFDMEADPENNFNIAAEHPDVVAELSEKLHAGYMAARLTK